jgi:succinate dehydrogenase / fumarate reductase membrane anchor subunit
VTSPDSTAAANDPTRSANLDIAAPRSQRSFGSSGRSNWELNSWLFMRISGVVLIFLVLGHLLIMNVLDGGVQRINFAFVAGRWSSPFWQVWDLLMLWLAQLHGGNGLRVIINDYAERDMTRLLLKAALYSSMVLILVTGTLVIFTFDPNIN